MEDNRSLGWRFSTGTSFERAELISELARTMSVREIEVQLSLARAKEKHPDATSGSLIELARERGIHVSRGAVQAYAKAWSTVVDADLRPDADLVELAFLLASTAGTADARKALSDAVRLIPSDARRDAFLADGWRILDGDDATTRAVSRVVAEIGGLGSRELAAADISRLRSAVESLNAKR